MSRIGKANHTNVTVGTTSVQVIGDNVNANETIIQNDHASNTVYLRLGTGAAVMNEGLKLAAGGMFSTDSYNGPVQAIASAAGTKLLVTRF